VLLPVEAAFDRLIVMRGPILPVMTCSRSRLDCSANLSSGMRLKRSSGMKGLRKRIRFTSKRLAACISLRVFSLPRRNRSRIPASTVDVPGAIFPGAFARLFDGAM